MRLRVGLQKKDTPGFSRGNGQENGSCYKCRVCLGFLTWDGWRLHHLGCFRVWACGTPGGFSKEGASYKSQDTGELRRDFPNELWRDSHKNTLQTENGITPSIATSNQVSVVFRCPYIRVFGASAMQSVEVSAKAPGCRCMQGRIDS